MIERRRFALLVIAGAVGVFAVLPRPAEHLDLFAAGIAVVAVAVLAGGRTAPRVGPGTPVIDAILRRDPFARRLAGVVAAGLAVGLVVALACAAGDVGVFGAIRAGAARGSPPWWTNVLYALYGGVTEEIVLRYGLLSAVLWLVARRDPGPAAAWSAILISALAMGLAHLPTTAAYLPLDPSAVARVLGLNLVAGTAFGWLYLRRGAEAAMVAHGVVDLLLHAALPGVFG